MKCRQPCIEICIYIYIYIYICITFYCSFSDYCVVLANVGSNWVSNRMQSFDLQVSIIIFFNYLQAPPLPPTFQAFDSSTNRLIDDVLVIFRRWLALKFPPMWRPVATCGCCESMHCFTAISRSCCEAICTLLHSNIYGFGSFRTLLRIHY